jgi:hypothetical protein
MIVPGGDLAWLLDRLARRRRGLGTALVAAAPALADEPVWSQVAPADTASLRAFLGAGYRPVAAEVLFGP